MASLALCACAAKPSPETLPCPPFPPLPRIAAVELQSLSADASAAWIHFDWNMQRRKN